MKLRIPALGVVVVLFGLLAMGANSSCSAPQSEFKMEERAITEAQQTRLIAAQPPPVLSQSLEREQLIKRLTRFNVADKVSYIYLVDRGMVMTFYPIKGKVSSVNSLLTTPDQFDKPCNGCENHVVSSPDLDGSYGSNGDAVFFFTTEDVYVEWNGTYMLVDQPLELSTAPAIVYVAPLPES